MKRAFPNPSLSPFEALAHLEAWTEIAGSVGQQRFETALKKCVAECKWFPKREEVEVRVPKSGMVLRGVTDQHCTECGGSGWRPVTPRTKENPHPAVSRCHCWRKELQSA